MSELYEVWDSIEDGIEDILKEANLGVSFINFGESFRVGKLRPPLIWVFDLDSGLDRSGMGDFWKYSFAVVGVVQDIDPAKGRREARRLASKAASALVQSRTLGNRVRNVRHERYIPAWVRGTGADQIHGVGYMLVGEFRHIE